MKLSSEITANCQGFLKMGFEETKEEFHEKCVSHSLCTDTNTTTFIFADGSCAVCINETEKIEVYSIAR